MSQNLTTRTRRLIAQNEVSPQFILEIDGIDKLYSSAKTGRFAKYGDDIEYGDEGLIYGGITEDPKSIAVLDPDKSTKRVDQQIKRDAGSVSSISNVKVRLIDLNGIISSDFQPGNLVDDILGRRADYFVIPQGGSHPEDSFTIYRGVISEVTPGVGYFDLRIAHPDQFKDSEIFVRAKAELDSGINSSVTTLTLNSTDNFLEPTSEMNTYVVINDEIIQYTGISGNDLTGLTRGSLNTIAASHSAEDTAESFYELVGNGLDLALKIMLSNPNDRFIVEDVDVALIGLLGAGEPLDNAIFFDRENVQEDFNLVVGDLVTLSGTASSDFIDGEIISFGTNSFGSWIVTDQSITTDSEPTATVSFKSQYNTLNEGLAMSTDFVDIEQHLRFLDLFSNSFPEMNIYLDDDEYIGRDLINDFIYNPNSLFNIPRSGRSSVNLTLPPISAFETKILDETNVRNLSSLKLRRTVNSNFYNAVVYKYERDSLEDKFLKGTVFLSQDSINRIKIPSKKLVIEAGGFRGDLSSFFERNAERLLNRYRYGAEIIENVKVMYDTGFNIEVGDTVFFGSDQMNLVDIELGSTEFRTKIMEVVDVSKDYTGDVTLTLINTGFSSNGRYGVVSPSSYVESATANSIDLKRSFFTAEGEQEIDKWTDFVGRELKIHNPDWSIVETFTLLSIDDVIPNRLNTTTLSNTPAEDWTVNIADYKDGVTAQSMSLAKAKYAFLSRHTNVDSATSDTVFTVDDITGIYVGCILRVHSFDFSNDSGETIVESIDGSEVTVTTSLGFTPSNGDEVRVGGFESDEGLPYRYL